VQLDKRMNVNIIKVKIYMFKSIKRDYKIIENKTRNIYIYNMD
jgi:hypothetical protein